MAGDRLPGARELDPPARGDRGDLRRSASGPVRDEPWRELSGPAEVVPGVAERRLEVEQVERAELAVNARGGAHRSHHSGVVTVMKANSRWSMSTRCG